MKTLFKKKFQMLEEKQRQNYLEGIKGGMQAYGKKSLQYQHVNNKQSTPPF